MNFRYEAVNRQAEVIRGTIDAASDRDALLKVQRDGLRVIRLDPAPVTLRGVRRGVSQRDLIIAMRQFSTLIRSGISVFEAAGAMARSTFAPAIAEGFEKVAGQLGKGVPLSRGLAECGIRFPPYLIELVRAGEMTGKTADCLEDALRQMEFDERIAREIRGALTYPAVLITAGIAAVAIIFLAVVPRFSDLLTRVDDMPLLAHVVLASGQFLNEHLTEAGALLLVAATLVFMQLRDAERRARLLAQVLTLPGFRTWARVSDMARWAGMLGVLLRHRVDIIDALELSRSAIRSVDLRQSLADTSTKVRGGGKLAAAIEPMGALPAFGIDLIRVGEQSGRLAEMLNSLSEILSDMAKERSERLVALLEPAAIIIIGGVIGLIMTGVVLAITSLNTVNI
ncbi:MAG: type II secretion system F family protein [Pseudomonadota bacterium]